MFRLFIGHLSNKIQRRHVPTSWKGRVCPEASAPATAAAAGPGGAPQRYCSSSGSRFSSRSAGTSVSECPASAAPRSGGKRSRTIEQQNLHHNI